MGRAWWAVLVVGAVGAIGCAGTNQAGEQSAEAVEEFPPIACTPATCEELGHFCGSTPDGCGGMLDCGTCSDGRTCTDGSCCGGNPDPCAPKSTGTITQLLQADGVYSSVSSDALGNTFVTRITANGSVLERLDNNGLAIWTKTTPDRLGAVIAAPHLEDVFTISVPNSATRALALPTVEHFSKSGAGPSGSQSLLAGSKGMAALAWNGSQAFVEGPIDGGKLTVRGANGATLFTFPTDIPVGVADAAFDINGGVVVGGQTLSAFEWKGVRWMAGAPFVAKLTPKGDVEWARQINAVGRLERVAMTSNGFVFATGMFKGILVFGTDRADSGSDQHAFVASWSPTGDQRFGHSLGAVLGSPKLAMDFTGVTFVELERQNCGPTEVMKYTGQGDLTWRRVYSMGCASAPQVSAITSAYGTPVLVGEFRNGGEVDGQRYGPGGFLMKLQP